MNLLKFPDTALLQKCVDVKIGDTAAVELLDEMVEQMYEWEGVGLAAPQIGVLKNMLVIDIREETRKIYTIINPKIINASENMIESHEGCLSLPFLRRTILRHEEITLQYLDENFEKKEIIASDFFACCIQHEVDHLNGVLYIDHLSRLKRAHTVKKYDRLINEYEEHGFVNVDDDAENN